MKLSKNEFKRFLEIMDDFGEYLFGTEKEIKNQLEICLKSQGYWSGNNIRVFFDEDTREFSIGSRY